MDGGVCCSRVAVDVSSVGLLTAAWSPLIPVAVTDGGGGGRKPCPTVGFNGVICGASEDCCIGRPVPDCWADKDDTGGGRVKLADGVFILLDE